MAPSRDWLGWAGLMSVARRPPKNFPAAIPTGSMAQLGMWKGVVDAAKLEQEGAEKKPATTLSGITAFLLWCVCRSGIVVVGRVLARHQGPT